MKTQAKELLLKFKSFQNLDEQLENPTNTKIIKDHSDELTEENLAKIRTILDCLDDYNKFEGIKSKNDIECFYSQINNCSMKERVVLETMHSLSTSNTNKNRRKFLKYNDIIEKDNKDELDIDKKIFEAVDRVVHKTLHKDKNEKNKNIICQIYNDLSDFKFKYSEKCSGYNNIDKLINSLKEKQPYIEFIAIKTIIISMMNLTQELINIYYKISEEINLNVNVNIINEENDISDDDDEFDSFELNPKIFEILFNDYIFISNRCSFLENYFIESFNNFRNKYKMDFNLSDLFTDVFWNKIFHNKILCKKFIRIYIGNDKCEDSIRKILAKIIKIISDRSIPVKSQIIQLLSLNNIEKEEIDLISTIIHQKNINHDYLNNERIINTVNYKALNPQGIMIDEDDSTDNTINEIKIEKKEEKKEKNGQILTEGEMEKKSVEEIYNYINDNSEIKTKKKKRNKKKKNKNKKNENKIKNSNEENKEDEDEIVLKFKEDLIKNVIDANRINKIKPVFSESYLDMISQKY